MDRLSDEAQVAATSLVTSRWRIDESAERFALRQMQLHEFIAACGTVRDIPRRIIADYEQEAEYQNG
jgi:hypothetical protein